MDPVIMDKRESSSMNHDSSAIINNDDVIKQLSDRFLRHYQFPYVFNRNDDNEELSTDINSWKDETSAA
jgi:hypothetical protein